MMTIISKNGVVVEKDLVFLSSDEIGDAESNIAVHCPNNHIPEVINLALQRISAIRIDFPDSGDGRGFSIARSLRQMGYRNRLRAAGNLFSDQFSFAIDCGFDEVEISPDVLRRQPLPHWSYKNTPGYRQKLFGRQTQDTQ